VRYKGLENLPGNNVVTVVLEWNMEQKGIEVFHLEVLETLLYRLFYPALNTVVRVERDLVLFMAPYWRELGLYLGTARQSILQ
jgi:hypothetical protein